MVFMWQKRRPALKPVCRFLMVFVCLAMLIPHRICLCCPCIAHQSNQTSTYTDCPPGSDSLEGDDSCPCHGHTRQASIVLPAKQCDQSCPTHDNHAPGCPTKILLHRSFNPTTPRHRLTIPVLRCAGRGSLPHPIQSANHYIQPEPCLGTTTAT